MRLGLKCIGQTRLALAEASGYVIPAVREGIQGPVSSQEQASDHWLDTPMSAGSLTR